MSGFDLSKWTELTHEQAYELYGCPLDEGVGKFYSLNPRKGKPFDIIFEDLSDGKWWYMYGHVKEGVIYEGIGNTPREAYYDSHPTPFAIHYW